MKTKIENKCPRVEWCKNCNMRIEQGKQTNIECMGAIQRVATVQFGEILSWCMKETFFMVRAINLILSIFDWIRSDRMKGSDIISFFGGIIRSGFAYSAHSIPI